MAACGRPVRWKLCTGSVWPTRVLAHCQADFLHILQPLNLKEGESETQMQAAWAGRLLSTAALVQPQWELQRKPPGFLPAARPLLPVATVSLQTPGAATEASHMVHIHSAGEVRHPGEGF